MVLPPKTIHPNGELEISLKKREIATLVADTFAGKIHFEWDPQAQVTPLGQLPFFIPYLKVGHLFEPWVDGCPWNYASHNAPKKVTVRVCQLFDALKAIAPQLTPLACWYRILSKAMKNYLNGMILKPPELLGYG